jgi:Cu-Zn family superoxide dismutase
MKLRLVLVSIAAAAIVAAPEPGAAAEAGPAAGDGDPAATGGAVAHADLKNLQGRDVGYVRIRDTADGVIVVARFSGLPEGTHAFHIHETGKCEPPFESAGGHFNPTDKMHGFAAAEGWHAGDMPNLEVPQGKSLEITNFVVGVDLAGDSKALLDADGAAFVVHARSDDYRTDPAGDAGDRIACGVIQKGATTGAERSASR